MTTVTKSKLKARMLAFLREVEATGEELVVTDHGRPVVKIVPYREKVAAETLFADARQRLAERGVAYDADELTAPLGEEVLGDADWAPEGGGDAGL